VKNKNITKKTDYTVIHHIATRIIKHDSDYISQLMAEIVKFQPFVASEIVGLSNELSLEESEEVISLYLIIWGVFRQYTECREIFVTQLQFESVKKRNLSMFKYLDGEDDTGLFGEIVRRDYEQMNYGILMEYIAGCLRKWPAVGLMNTDHYCNLVIGLKSFIESLEEIVASEQKFKIREKRA
jgi:hypothetical protein